MATEHDGDNEPLSSILSATADAMTAGLQAGRVAFDHHGIAGTTAEEIVTDFLNQRLPASTRAVTGQAVDHTGRRSRQLDIIVYDTSRTPLLFASTQGSQNLVPIEGVLAVVEVKMKLTADGMRSSAVNCASVKQLDSSARLSENPARVFDLYGSTWHYPPPYYSVFAFKSDGLYAELMNDELGRERPVHEQIDTVVCLDRGVCLNATVDVVGESDGTRTTTHFSATPEDGSIRVNVNTDKSLVVWYAMSASTIIERLPSPTVDVTRYLREELRVSGTVESGQALEALRDRLVRQFSDAIGLDLSIAQKMSTPAELTLREFYTLLRHPSHALRDVPGTDAPGPELRQLKQTAEHHDFAQWMEMWFPGRDPDGKLRGL